MVSSLNICRRRKILRRRLAIVGFLVTTVVLCSGFAAARAAQAEEGVREGPAGPVHLFDSHHEALAAWASAGVKNAVLIHVDAHHDMLSAPGAEGLAELRALVAKRDWGRLRDAGDGAYSGQRYGLSDFVVAAHRLGIIREVWWVYPLRRPLDGLFLEYLKGFLLNRQFGMFDGAEVEELELRDGEVRGTLHGVPLRVVRMEDLAPLQGEVLLDIDCDYFPERMIEGGMGGALQEFLVTWGHLGIVPRMTTIATSVGGGYTPLQFRYIGEVLSRKLGGNDDPKDAWDLLWQAEAHLEKGNTTAARSVLASVPTGAAARPHADLYLAFVAMYEGEHERAVKGIEALLDGGQEVWVAYWLWGRAYAASGAVDRAAEVFQRLGRHGRKARYAMHNGLGNLAFNQRDFEAAARHYQQALKEYPHKEDVAGYLADAYFAAGRFAQALELYRKLFEEGSHRIWYENRNVLPNLVAAAQRTGDRALAEGALREMMRRFPQESMIDRLHSQF